MKKTIILICTLFILTDYCKSQKIDTIYYDKNWIESTPNNFKYYRIARQDSGVVRVIDYYKSGQIQMTGSYKTFDFKDKVGSFYYFSKNNRVHQLELHDSSLCKVIINENSEYFKYITQQPDSFTLKIFYHNNNKIKSINYVYAHNELFGKGYYFTRNGQFKFLLTYSNKKRNGPYFMNIKNRLWESGSYKDNKRDGEWKFFNNDGTIRKTIFYQDGKIIKKIR